MKNSLRLWIRVVLAITLIGLAAGLIIGNQPQKKEKAKYIFLFIADGMGASQVTLAESYHSYQKGALGGERLTFSNFPYFGMATTYSANRRITCSAAAGTAIACGEKTINTRIGMDPEGNKLKSMCYDLKEDGYKIGIISTAPVNHATPASFYASVEDRGKFYEIMQTIPETGFEFFAGSGFKKYYGNDKKQTGAEEYLEARGYDVCFGEDEYLARKEGTEKVVLCQKHNKGRHSREYTIVDPEGAHIYTLKDMLERGMEVIGEEEPFFFMCEGGTIDWAAHENNTMATISLIDEFDEAVKLAYDFYLKHPDETLIIVTSDHDTGGASLGNGIEWLDDRLDWSVLDSAWNMPSGKDSLSIEENKALNDKAFIGWTTMQHTGNDVPVYAVGNGAERFSGKMDNTEFKSKILAL